MSLETFHPLKNQPPPTIAWTQQESRPSLSRFNEDLRKHSVHHVATETMKSLLFLKRSDLIAARNQVKIPLGLFGLSLDSFYARRKQNIVYLDVLKLAPRDTLEQAKLCIVLDDIQSYVEALFDAYENNNLKGIVNVIRNSQKMLTVHQQIEGEYKNNLEMQKRLLSKLGAFNVRERRALMYMQGQLYNAQNNLAEGLLVVDPIECRYKLKYYQEKTKQATQEMTQKEDGIKKQLANIIREHSREVAASEAIQMKLMSDVAAYRRELNDMLQEYNTAYDSLDSQITYKINSMGVMKEQRRDCEEKLIFFAANTYRLMEWLEKWEKQKRKSRGKSGTKSKKK